MRTKLADGLTARRQAGWIAALEPWHSLGYRADALARWLGRMGRMGRVLVAVRGKEVQGIAVVQPEVLLGQFISLLAVRPEAAGQGMGRALVQRIARGSGRWLYTSTDERNRAAAGFYLKLGFVRVGRLPDLVVRGRAELLWRYSSKR